MGTLVVSLLCLARPAPGQQVTNLAAYFRSGQVFLTWNEPTLAATDTVIVFRSKTAIPPITEPACVPLARLWPKSGQDVFRNDGGGYVIQDGGARISSQGLLVHTVYPGEEGDMYYAVAVKSASGAMVTAVTPGGNVLAAPVTGQKVEPIQPVWQIAGSSKPAAGAGAGKPIHLTLHAKGSAIPTRIVEYVAFPDSSMGWQEGVPFKFGMSLQGTNCSLIPMDATYVRRTIEMDPDSRSNLIWSWWYGYNDKILWPDQMKSGKVVNYTERRVLWMIRWAQDYLKTDPNRTYSDGTSMGGCGGFSLGMHNPDVFAAIRIRVPNTFYNSLNEYRFTGYCGPLTTMTSEGMSLVDRMNGPVYLKKSQGISLPFLVINNGRTDASMPWANVPAGYKALDANRHGFVAAWNNGSHSSGNTGLPQDLKFWDEPANFDPRFALNKSFPAFSNASSNQDPGTGTTSSGAQTGYMNRNLDWNEPVETAARYEVLIKQFSASVVPAPVTMDVTLRRLQRFRFPPGSALKAVNINASSQTIQEKVITVDSLGLITFPGFTLTSAAGNRLVVTPGPGTRTIVPSGPANADIRLTYAPGSRGVAFRFPPGGAMKRVRIFDMAGGLTQDLSSRADIIEWDLLDANRRPVVGKVNLARCAIEGGASRTFFILAQRNRRASD
ncbi:MAG: hypothetical protein ABIW76_16145 [Fibrobacteria bacterium]